MAAKPKIGLIKAQNSNYDILGTLRGQILHFPSFNGLHLR